MPPSTVRHSAGQKKGQFMQHRGISSGVLLLVFVTTVSAPADASVEITQCYPQVPEGETAVLQADLDCSVTDPPPFRSSAIELLKRATLDMNGHTIQARSSGFGVHCQGTCTILGPGTITGAFMAVLGGRGRMKIAGVNLLDNAGLIDVTDGRLDVMDMNASSSGTGIRARAMRATNLAVTTSRNGDCVLVTRSIRGSDVTVWGCHTGIRARRVRIDRLTVIDNISSGLLSVGAVRLTDSVLTGNTFIGAPADLLSFRRPRLERTTCGTSVRLVKDDAGGWLHGPSWGVCADD